MVIKRIKYKVGVWALPAWKAKWALEDPAAFEEEGSAMTLLFSSFFRPPDGRKNLDLMNYSIHPSDWPVACHSRAWRSSRISVYSRRINQWTISNYFRRNATIFRIKFVLKAKQKKAIENFFKTKLKIQGRINKLQALKETPLLVYCFKKKLFCLKGFFFFIWRVFIEWHQNGGFLK